MSTVIKMTMNITNVSENFSQANVGALSVGMQCLTQGLNELNYAYEKEKELTNCDQELVKVSLLITTLEGKKIGVIERKGGIDFVLPDLQDAMSLAAVKKIKQRFSKFAMIHELQSKGYSKIKEEKLPNGKIRLVMEKEE